MDSPLASRLSSLVDGLWFRRAWRRRFERAHARRLPIGPDGIVTGAESIYLQGAGRHAALLVHGFNDTPQSMAYLASALHRAGYTVAVPRLPGHGVSLPNMARTARASLWGETVSDAYAQLRAAHGSVAVCGQSMGGALAVLLASAHPELPAVVLLAPYLGMPVVVQVRVLLSWWLSGVMPYRVSRGGERSLHDPDAKARALGPGVVTSRTMRELRRVARAGEAALRLMKAPTLYIQSTEDNRISTATATRCFALLGSTEKTQRWVSGCGHIISADYCRDEVAHHVVEWFDGHAKRTVGASAAFG